MNTAAWPGSKWWKVDFHSHTPASHDYGKGTNDQNLKRLDPQQWLLSYMKAGIDCVVVSDHNSGEWIDRLKRANTELKETPPADYRPLTVFPGVEISVNGGVHLLAILPDEKGTGDVDRLLGQVGYNGVPGESNVVTTESFVKVVSRIVEMGGIAIPAHVDKPSGLFKELTGSSLDQVLCIDDIFAAEFIDKDYCTPQLYIDKNLSWTKILGSDSHHPTGEDGGQFPGSHYTWVKMEHPSIEGLRLALLDGDTSIQRSDSTTVSPNKSAGYWLHEISVENAKYMGRNGVFQINLNPWLNTIIGGRGTGKSSTLEFLRLALGRQHEVPTSLSADFEKYSSSYSKTKKNDGLLTDGAKIHATYEKNGIPHRIEWSNTNQSSAVFELVDQDKWEQIGGDPKVLFPLRIYSQKQIFELAKHPQGLLNIIDEADEINKRPWQETLDQLINDFMSQRAEARALLPVSKDNETDIQLLKDLNNRISILENDSSANTLKAFEKSDRKKRALDTWERNLEELFSPLQKYLEASQMPELDLTAFDEECEEDTELLLQLEEVRKQQSQIFEQLANLHSKSQEILGEWHTTRQQSAFEKSSKRIQESYESLTSQFGGSITNDYSQLLEKRANLEYNIEKHNIKLGQSKEKQTQSLKTLKDIIEHRSKLSSARKLFLEQVLEGNQFVKIELKELADNSNLDSQLRSLLSKENAFGNDFEKLSNLIQSNEDKNVGLECLKSTLTSQDRRAKFLSDNRFKNHLNTLPPETFDRIETWFPEDKVEVSFCPSRGKRFTPIDQGSPGQKTAALLAFILSNGDEPLLLDQPEDDLDNSLIYSLIVSQLREAKSQRQIIVVTHNANIVVNGDAENVVCLHSPRGQTVTKTAGGLQCSKIRAEVCNVMEGGKTAFENRYRRIQPFADPHD
ncbi:hypothetical protein PsW64_00989 [Pseudovibrio sp. W64]|uniref:TrlF family AAA-like ATPase n=1 Tax=Pseudovibrio sp. W64 TaxID=1735583 RepID=UPI0007AEA4B4|nr:AAA family ATPase [Pseudovibrio sp. W64]KZK87692.1 hypothetical protein PsW64_00989 [Pseudovibrio sp. W64]